MPFRHPKAIYIEVRGRVAGLAVPDSSGFRFVAADGRFTLLDGSRFRRLHALQHAANQLDSVSREPLLEAAAGR
jgi:hypothetical protein